jgi:hypothetical protein
MSDIKNPDHEAENPASMPEGGSARKARMAPRHDAPPGLEQDSQGNTIPVDQRTPDDQEKARGKTPD